MFLIPLISQEYPFLLELAPLRHAPVAGCHRASPSTSLDKSLVYAIVWIKS
ncbi:hypothetical protein SCACP_07350 [Sporomusa carbonis]